MHEIYDITCRLRVTKSFLWTGNEDFVPGTVVFSSYETAAQSNSVCKNLKWIAINLLHTIELSKNICSNWSHNHTSHQLFTSVVYLVFSICDSYCWNVVTSLITVRPFLDSQEEKVLAQDLWHTYGCINYLVKQCSMKVSAFFYFSDENDVGTRFKFQLAYVQLPQKVT